MTARDIDTEVYLADLRGLAARYEVSADVTAVPSIQDWCRERSIVEENPSRAGRTLRNNMTGRYLILLACPVTGQMVSSIVTAMDLRGFGIEATALSDPDSFMTHLMLHEIAHARDELLSEVDCDRWAFEQLPSNLPLNRPRERASRAG
jgi:hypothetical protein